jgi:hypothetical protein
MPKPGTIVTSAVILHFGLNDPQCAESLHVLMRAFRRRTANRKHGGIPDRTGQWLYPRAQTIVWPDPRPPRFRCVPLHVMWPLDSGRASVPRLAVPHMLPSIE